MIRVLDYGFVRLISYMQPAVPDPAWTGDLEVVRNARVSYNADWREGSTGEGDNKLIRYLHNNSHTSPFEAMVFTFEVKAPLFVLRQWHRHRTWSYNEVSARYTELPEEYYVPPLERFTGQSKSNKQMSDDTRLPEADQMRDAIDMHCKNSFVLYQSLLQAGLTRELARGVLPLNVYSRMFATVDLHNLIGFIRLRNHSHAQPEIQDYARGLIELVAPIVPATMLAFIQAS